MRDRLIDRKATAVSIDLAAGIIGRNSRRTDRNGEPGGEVGQGGRGSCLVQRPGGEVEPRQRSRHVLPIGKAGIGAGHVGGDLAVGRNLPRGEQQVVVAVGSRCAPSGGGAVDEKRNDLPGQRRERGVLRGAGNHLRRAAIEALEIWIALARDDTPIRAVEAARQTRLQLRGDVAGAAPAVGTGRQAVVIGIGDSTGACAVDTAAPHRRRYVTDCQRLFDFDVVLTGQSAGVLAGRVHRHVGVEARIGDYLTRRIVSFADQTADLPAA